MAYCPPSPSGLVRSKGMSDVSNQASREARVMRDDTGLRAMPSVVVAMATYRRPACLSRILPELVRQTSSYVGSASILVVDNDPDESARDAVIAWADQGVRYVHEPKPGIAAARNKALAEAGDAELLLFV